MEQALCVEHLIDEDGKFDGPGLDKFVEDVKLSSCGLDYVVVSIMGPQSSGKSTLLNHLFQTDFKEMDAQSGCKQTTRGIWIANCVGIEPRTIVLDLEGNDGIERGLDDSFEKKIALFALAVSDIMLINMWGNDIGREHAGNRSLLRTIFEVMMRLFGPGHKTTLVFVIRDRSKKTPETVLKAQVLDNVDKLWNEVPKSQEHTSTRLNDIFRVEVVLLPNYEFEEDLFMEQVAQLRQRFSNSISEGGLAAYNRDHVVPASAFSLSAQNNWEIIKDDRDLDLPSQKVMVANIRCEEIAQKMFDKLIENQEWLELERAVKTGPVEGFGKKMSLVLAACLSEYEMEAKYFDEGVRNSKRDALEKKALDFVYPTYRSMLDHVRSKVLKELEMRLEKTSMMDIEELSECVPSHIEHCMTMFDDGHADAAVKQAVDWDVSSIRDKLRLEMETYAYVYVEPKIKEMPKFNLEDKTELAEGSSSGYLSTIREFFENEDVRSMVSSYVDLLRSKSSNVGEESTMRLKQPMRDREELYASARRPIQHRTTEFKQRQADAAKEQAANCNVYRNVGTKDMHKLNYKNKEATQNMVDMIVKLQNKQQEPK